MICIPDCSALKTDTVARYILKDALRVALSGAYHKRMDSLYLSSDFTTFMQSIHEPCVLIADRWEAAPPDSMTSDVLLTLFACLYPTFYSARPIKPYYPGCSMRRMKDAIFRVEGLGAVRCTSNAIYIRVLNTVYLEDELSAWLVRRNKLSRIVKEYRHDIEYLTGSVPLLLNSITSADRTRGSLYDVITKSDIVKEITGKINTSLDERIAKHGTAAYVISIALKRSSSCLLNARFLFSLVEMHISVFY